MYLTLTEKIKNERCQLMNEIFQRNNLKNKSDFKGFYMDGDYIHINNIDVFSKSDNRLVLTFEIENCHRVCGSDEDWLSSFNLAKDLLFEQFKDDEYKSSNDYQIILTPQQILRINELYDFSDEKNDVFFVNKVFKRIDCLTFIEQTLLLQNNFKLLDEI